VTAAQLASLAELGAFAAGFFCTTHPDAAEVFRDAAFRAEALSAELWREEKQARHRTEMPGSNAELPMATNHPR
jgi:hypothetical protein